MGNKKLSNILGVDFNIDKDHWSRYKREELEEVGKAIESLLMESDWDKFLQLGSLGFFDIFIPELAGLKKVPQNKIASKDAFHHSLTVVCKIQKNRVLKWAALLHDIGKLNFTVENGKVNFLSHEYHGSKMAKGILKRMKIKNTGDICRLIQYHSHPLDYQRQPNWKMSTVKKFINKHEHLSLFLIDLAIADKIASSNYSPYLESLYQLKITVEALTSEAKAGD